MIYFEQQNFVLYNLFSVFSTPCSVLPALCFLLRAPYILLRASCSVFRNLFSVLPAPCFIPLLNAPYAELRASSDHLLISMVINKTHQSLIFLCNSLLFLFLLFFTITANLCSLPQMPNEYIYN